MTLPYLKCILLLSQSAHFPSSHCLPFRRDESLQLKPERNSRLRAHSVQCDLAKNSTGPRTSVQGSASGSHLTGQIIRLGLLKGRLVSELSAASNGRRCTLLSPAGRAISLSPANLFFQLLANQRQVQSVGITVKTPLCHCLACHSHVSQCTPPEVLNRVAPSPFSSFCRYSFWSALGIMPLDHTHSTTMVTDARQRHERVADYGAYPNPPNVHIESGDQYSEQETKTSPKRRPSRRPHKMPSKTM